MKGFNVFFSKEIRELIRTKKLMILLTVFFIVGLMNPAVAKLTPKLLESIDMYGMTVGEINITALDSWTQFAKNISTAMIVFIIMFSGIFTLEYSRNTLIPLLIKGLSRRCVVMSKTAVMLLAWSACLWMCFGITYFYSGYYWDNSVVDGIFFAGFGWWLFGVFMISCIVFFSSFAGSAVLVLLGTGGIYITMSLLGLYKKIEEYLPIHLCDSLSLYNGELTSSDYLPAVIATGIICLLLFLISIPLTGRRQL